LIAAVIITRFAQTGRYCGTHRAASSKAVANLQAQLAFHRTIHQDSDQCQQQQTTQWYHGLTWDV